MMKNGYEYYYLFGLDIPLEKYGLGTIKQPKIIDYISQDMDMEKLHTPFISLDYLTYQLRDKMEQLDIINQMGKLEYLIFISSLGDQKDILMSIVDAIGVLYRTKDVKVDDNLRIVVNGNVFINSSNFDILSNIALEMLMVNKPVFEESKPKYKNKKLQETWEKLQKYRAKEAKKNELKVVDIMNTLAHIDGRISYDKVMNMTMYQLKNSYGMLMNQEVYKELMKYKTSGQFKLEKDIKHWTIDSKVKRSAYSDNE